MPKPSYRTALIVGAGRGLSASLARLFASEGLRVALAARDTEKLAPLCAETGAQAFACDAVRPDQVARLFTAVESAIETPDVVVYNASARARGPVAELIPAEVERAIMVSAFGGFLVAREAALRMVPKGHGAILFTGASASVKGYPLSAPFAMGKFALRGLAQSMDASLRRKAFTSPISSSTGGSAIPGGSSRRTGQTACSIPMRSPPPISMCCTSRARPGPGKSKCGHGSSGSESV
jgi:NAD(P)-dependent dehydrogenase (short-subunit alcohol dehydrogenase family)